jgi:hypothetical protein
MSLEKNRFLGRLQKDWVEQRPQRTATMERPMGMSVHKSITTAVLAAAFALGGLGAATAHHGNVSEHSTTKGKNLGEIDRLERRITADLNRKQAIQGPQLALATPAPTNQVIQPMNETPSAMPAMPDDEQAPAEVEGEDAPNP